MGSRLSSALFLAMLPLLAAALVSCTHKQPPPPPPASTAPPLPPTSMTKVPPVPTMPAPAQPKVGPPGSDQQVQETPPAPPRHPKRAKKHTVPTAEAVAPAAPAANAPPAVAAVTPPPEPSLGQLSAGAGADSRERAAMSEQIHEQELRLSKIKHPLNDEDQAIAKQVEVFLTKARQAVAENDLDGAQTLTTKAKVLLDELTRS